VRARDPQLDAREGQAGPSGVAERPALAKKPGNSGGAKGPWFKVNAGSGDSREIGVSLLPPTKVGKLQKALHAKAKRSPDYRFYALYDKVFRADVLSHAYRTCQVNGGEPGVDGQMFDDIEEYGRGPWLDELAEELRTKRIAPRRFGEFTFPNRANRSVPDRSGFRRSETVL
jgi:hypothetical protein